MSFTLKAAEEVGVLEVLFQTISAFCFMCYLHFPHLIQRGFSPLKDFSLSISLFTLSLEVLNRSTARRDDATRRDSDSHRTGDSDRRLVGVVRPSSFVFVSALISVQLGSDLLVLDQSMSRLRRELGSESGGGL
ncbi:hypothetical protein F0562_005544 [Nyssa sinensis]|uniref:Uncharacterized protein n=1 Tax=Nyssa sinensis TaxID=561372 RepID=A0A5J5AM44_9ASTE|nr:hypothetical protein F0562_005544 [Nyssa sinensis]